MIEQVSVPAHLQNVDWDSLFNADGTTNDYLNVPSFGIYNTGTERSKYQSGLFNASDFPKPDPGRPGFSRCEVVEQAGSRFCGRNPGI